MTEPDRTDRGAKPAFADFIVSIGFHSQHSTAEELSTILGLRPAHSRIADPSPEYNSGARYRLYFRSGCALPSAPFALEQFDAHLLAQLRPFAEHPERLAEVRRCCERIVVSCSVRTSRNLIMTPLSAETLRLLTMLGCEFHFTSSTRSTTKLSGERSHLSKL
jgi:hypothetical protein